MVSQMEPSHGPNSSRAESGEFSTMGKKASKTKQCRVEARRLMGHELFLKESITLFEDQIY